MSKEDTMTETEKLEEAVAVLRHMRANRAGTNNAAIAGERRALDTVIEALTAWNTRPDEGVPVAYRRRSKNLNWEYRDDGSTSVVATDWLPLYTRPSVVEPVAWREAVAALTGLDDDEWEVLKAHCPEDLRRLIAMLLASQEG
jgi:hypothetical protein